VADAMKKYCVVLEQHELNALRQSVTYLRAIAYTLNDDKLTAVLTNYAQMLEDVVSRIETMDIPP